MRLSDIPAALLQNSAPPSDRSLSFESVPLTTTDAHLLA